MTILKFLGENKKRRTISLWFFHGDRKYGGQFEKKIGEKEPGYGGRE